jgi:hypothetical protein
MRHHDWTETIKETVSSGTNNLFVVQNFVEELRAAARK